MKAEELMLGDWVYCEGQPTPDNVTIETIAEDGVWFNGPNYEGAASYDRIFPITITPEILEKNGFTNIGENVWQWEEKPFWVWWEEKNHHLGIEIDDSSYDEEKSKTIMIIVQNYIHELQHALRLCGIEKEIML